MTNKRQLVVTLTIVTTFIDGKDGNPASTSLNDDYSTTLPKDVAVLRLYL